STSASRRRSSSAACSASSRTPRRPPRRRRRARRILSGVTFVLTAVGAALAVALELFEAMAIVLAVALTRRPADALLGVVGVALLLFGMEWLRKGVLRLAGRRARSDSYAEFVAEQEALAEEP